jgi:molecular chaperone HscC
MTVVPFAARRTMVGIDLGTTNSLVAILQDGRPVIIPNRLGELLTPSAVSVDEGGAVLVGAPALARATTHPRHTVLAFKRDMGTDRVQQLGNKSFRAPELSALILKSLREDAEAFLGRPVEEAVITVPAYFDEVQRRATRDAATIAGLPVERIINEPTAAALAYGLHHRARSFRAAVLDLGGGTFDVTVLEVMEGVIEIQSSAGDTRLGGEDFVDALLALMTERLGLGQALAENPVARARLRLACEEAKRRLSTAEQTRVVLPGLELDGRRRDVDEVLTRTDAEGAWSALLARIGAPILRALRDAGAQADQIDEVLLVGGATRMPCVFALAARLFGKPPLRELPPDEAVAMGAAVQAALKGQEAAVDDLVVTDVAPFSMGIAVGSNLGRTHLQGLYAPVLERGTVIPASRIEPFSTASDGQTQMEVEVFQGEHSLCRDNRKLGSFMVKGLPPRPAGAVRVDVRFTYDLNGLLEVEATIADTGRKFSAVFEQTPGRLSAAQIEAARKGLERLKFHPREALPNVTALNRAEAVYVELRGEAREALSAALAQFRATLERQDPGAIERARETLVAVTAAVSGLNPPRR